MSFEVYPGVTTADRGDSALLLSWGFNSSLALINASSSSADGLLEPIDLRLDQSIPTIGFGDGTTDSCSMASELL